MRGASVLTAALASAWLVLLASTVVPGCLAELLPQEQASLKDAFKAVLLEQRRSSLPHDTRVATSAVEKGEGQENRKEEEEEEGAAEAAATAAAESLAQDLVQALSELLRQTEERVGVTESVLPAVEAAWGSPTWRELRRSITEGAREGEKIVGTTAALFGEPYHGKQAAAMMEEEGGRHQRTSGVLEGRRLRGDGLGGGGKAAAVAPLPEEAAAAGGVFSRRMLADVPVGCPEVGGGEEDFLKIESKWMNVALTFVCVVCAGLAAGLTMGLVSIEPLEMAIKQRSGTPDEQRQASRILPLVSRHHFLLVTLLLFNSLANEALPIFLGNLVPSWLAVILSVSLVLFFGEIFPSAVFTGKGQLAIAAGMAWFVYTLMFVLGPIAWPISWILDRVLGIEGFKRYNRAEIAALVEVQHELSTDDVTNLPLHQDEVSIVNGVLQTAEKSVSQAMITMDKVFCLSQSERLSANTMADIMASGYSRVLVYEGEDTRNIRGYLQVKKLIVLDPEDERAISSLMLRIPVVVSPTKSLLELLNTFQTGRSHLALVSHSPAITLESLKHGVRLEGAARPVGIITLEDIIEEIIQEEIMDESDRLTQFIENRAKDTLLRFTRMRRERHIMGRYSSLALGTPVKNKDKSLLKHLGSNGSPLRVSANAAPPSPSYGTHERGDGSPTPSVGSPPAAPGLGERAGLISNSQRPGSGSNRRLATGRPAKRGASPTVAEAIIAVAAGRAREHSSGGAASSEGSSRPLLAFRQGSTGSVNDGGSPAATKGDGGGGGGRGRGRPG